jgi:hypothetical protein
MPGTQPVSLNISLASFRRAINSLGTALLIDGEAANWTQVRGLPFDEALGPLKQKPRLNKTHEIES